MPTRKRRAARSGFVTRAEFTQLRKELARFRVMVKANAAAIEVLRRDCATNLRRCGELQRDIDALKKIWG